MKAPRRPRFRDPARDRPSNAPVLDMLGTLQAEVEHAERRLEAAQRDLRRWLLSHGPEAGPRATNDAEAMP